MWRERHALGEACAVFLMTLLLTALILDLAVSAQSAWIMLALGLELLAGAGLAAAAATMVFLSWQPAWVVVVTAAFAALAAIALISDWRSN